MTIQNGALVLIKVGDGGEPENFATIGGLRTSRIALNNQAIHASHHDSGVWRQLLPGGGIRSMAISGTGLFTDGISEETLRGYAFGGTVNNYRFIFANGDYVAGPFLIASYERGGNHNGEEIYAITLESAGAITFTSA